VTNSINFLKTNTNYIFMVLVKPNSILLIHGHSVPIRFHVASLWHLNLSFPFHGRKKSLFCVANGPTNNISRLNVYVFEKFELSVPPGVKPNLDIDVGLTTRPFPFKLCVRERAN